MDRKEVLDQLEDAEPVASIELFQVEVGDKSSTGLAVHVNFGKKGPPKSFEDASIPQVLVMALSNHLTKLMEEMTNVKPQVLSGDEVLSSFAPAPSKEKDAIDKQLEELGITPKDTTTKEVH